MGLESCQYHSHSFPQNLGAILSRVLLMGRVRFNYERGRKHKTRALIVCAMQLLYSTTVSQFYGKFVMIIHIVCNEFL